MVDPSNISITQIALFMFFVITSVQTHKVVESTEDIEPPERNITQLYPIILNITNIKSDKRINEAEINLKEKEARSIIHIESNVKALCTQHSRINNQTNNDTSKEIIKTHEEIKERPLEKTTWRIETGFAEANVSQKDIDDKVVGKNIIEDFRPSQLLGYIVEDFTPRTVHEDFSSPVTRPSAEFISSPKDEYLPAVNQIPNEILQNYKPFPYKFESYTKGIGSWSPDVLDAKPKEKSPVELPAGDLYQLSDDFNEYSGLRSNHEDLGYGIQQSAKEHLIRVNPWKELLHLATAILPAGLLISALAPSVINISPGVDNYYPSKFRRSDGSVLIGGRVPISETCRRRLLCELHSDQNYADEHASIPGPSRRHKQCYKVHCEDTQALFKMLQWLLSYHKPVYSRGRDLI